MRGSGYISQKCLAAIIALLPLALSHGPDGFSLCISSAVVLAAVGKDIAGRYLFRQALQSVRPAVR